jgi:hypothetical protein
MKNPTIEELMEYLDGTLTPLRYNEIEVMISKSSGLQKEILLLKAVQKTVRNDIAASPSRKFTAHVLKEILPVQQESFWLRALKNSSNIFAMVLVLSMIGIVLVSNPSSSTGSTSALSKNIESYSATYNTVIEAFSNWTKQYTHPVNQAVNTTSGKFLIIGLFAFFVLMIIDEFFGNRYFHSRIKN